MSALASQKPLFCVRIFESWVWETVFCIWILPIYRRVLLYKHELTELFRPRETSNKCSGCGSESLTDPARIHDKSIIFHRTNDL